MAVDAVVCSGEEHTYLAPSSKVSLASSFGIIAPFHDQGSMCIVRSRGNKNTQVVLRGGRSGPNYQEDKVAKCVELLRWVFPSGSFGSPPVTRQYVFSTMTSVVRFLELI